MGQQYIELFGQKVGIILSGGGMGSKESRVGFFDKSNLPPQHLVDSVNRKNKALAERRAAAGNVEKRSVRKPVRYTQEQINEMVDTRDLNLYPLSGSELLDIANRRNELLNF